MVSYDAIISAAAVRVGAVTGNTPAQKDTSLGVNPLTATQIGSVEFPFTTIKSAVLSAVARVMRGYANVKNQPLRLFNQSFTANIANKGLIPFVDASSKQIIGVYGSVVDSSDNSILTEQPKQLVESINRSVADSSLKRSYYYFAIEDGIITHTRDNVKIQVNTFDLAAEKAKIGTINALSPLPDACFDIAWVATICYLFNDEAYLNQVQAADAYVTGQIAQMQNGATSFDPAPAFLMTAGAN